MANVLYLVHRMPYPPNKGDKVRSYHLLKHLAKQHQVFVGTFIDDPADAVHVPKLRALCAGLHVARLHPLRARIASLPGLLRGEALTLGAYRNAGLQRWVQTTLAQQAIDAVVVFSSAMAQYVELGGGVGTGAATAPVLVDFVDVDSAKWAAYAGHHGWPLSWLYRREGATLLAHERAVAAEVQRGFFATQKETELFVGLAPECSGAVEAMGNGVDADYFSPAADRVSPFAAGDAPLVFTGAMDYWPNIDAVTWFAREVFPLLRSQRPGLQFHIVGRAPTPAVRALQGDGVVVTGTVPDVRPYLQHAAVVVAPLRLARGIQNKILEAMAMGRPVVAATACVQATTAEPGRDILAADDAGAYADAITQMLDQPQRAAALGAAGRARVLHSYTWDAHMSVIDRYLPAGFTSAAFAAPSAVPPAAAAARNGVSA